MSQSSPPMLDYRDPSREPRRRFQRVFDGRFRPYVSGTGFGSVLLAFALIGKAPGVIEELMVGVVAFVLCSIAMFLAVGIHALRDRLDDEGSFSKLGSRLFGPLVTLLYYPVAHALLCKAGAIVTGSDMYATRVSPFHFLPVWLAFGVALTAVAWRCRPLGEVPLDWTLAGMTAPLSAWALVEGAHYLEISATASSQAGVYWNFLLDLVVMFFAVPLVVGLTFSPLAPQPARVIATADAAEIAARIESISSPRP
jgi:hypothetical protein